MMKLKTLKLEELKSSTFSEDTINTDIIAFDSLINQNLEKGSIIELVAESGMGKSTIACQICCNICSKGGKVLYIDAEGKLSIDLIKSIGLDQYIDDNFFYIRKSAFNEVEEVLDMFISTEKINYVVIDSIASLVHEGFVSLNKDTTNSEKKCLSITTNNSNYNSKRLTMFFNKYNSLAKKYGITFIMTNQFRNIPDIIKSTIIKEYGPKCVRYYASSIINILPLSSTGVNKNFKKINKTSIGCDLVFEVSKSNKTYPGRKIPFYFIYGKGVSNVYSIMYALIELGYIKENNSYYTYEKDGIKKVYHGINELVNDQELFNNSMNIAYDFYSKL